jgi:hypothetical protein
MNVLNEQKKDFLPLRGFKLSGQVEGNSTNNYEYNFCQGWPL